MAASNTEVLEHFDDFEWAAGLISPDRSSCSTTLRRRASRTATPGSRPTRPGYEGRRSELIQRHRSAPQHPPSEPLIRIPDARESLHPRRRWRQQGNSRPPLGSPRAAQRLDPPQPIARSRPQRTRCRRQPCTWHYRHRCRRRHGQSRDGSPVSSRRRADRRSHELRDERRSSLPVRGEGA